MAKKTDKAKHESTSEDTLYEASPELLAVESSDQDIKPSDVPPREDPKSEHLEVNKPKNRLRRFFDWFWRKKWFTIPGTLLLILVVLLAIPVTRYGLTSWFWKESIVIGVTDTRSHQAVSEATVTIGDQTLKTDKDGKAKFVAIPVGDRQVSITKKYYKQASMSITVPWFAKGQEFDQTLEATGRPVDVSVTQKLTGDALGNVAINLGNEVLAHTDDKGVAHLVVPADKDDLTVTLTADGYITAQATIKQSSKNEFQLTPVGHVYFLSKQSGTIDVVSTNLDGSDRKVVVAGTGNEESTDTNLLASRDWKYLVLHAKREAGKPARLYLIDTSKGVLETIEQTDVNITLIGWSDHHFLYSTYDNTTQQTDPGQQSLKTYNAETRKLAIVDNNQVAIVPGYGLYKQTLANFYILDDGIVYTRTWAIPEVSSNIPPTDKLTEIVKISADGSSKKTIKSYQAASVPYVGAQLYAPQDIYFQLTDKEQKNVYAELEDGTYHEGVDGTKYGQVYSTYLISPGGSQSFWSEARDGKYALLTGDKSGNNKQQLATGSDYQAYGWFTDNYLLLQKGGSELYITSPKQLKAGVPPLKISDYHKAYSFGGYGYGYGGL